MKVELTFPVEAWDATGMAAIATLASEANHDNVLALAGDAIEMMRSVVDAIATEPMAAIGRQESVRSLADELNRLADSIDAEFLDCRQNDKLEGDRSNGH